MKKILVIALASAVCGLAWLTRRHEMPRTELNAFRASHSLRELQTAERSFAAANPNVGYTCDLSQLARAGLVDRVIAQGQKAGYRFSLSNCTLDASGKVTSFRANAAPESLGLGALSFCSDEHDVIWYTKSSSTADCFESRLKWDKPDIIAP